MKAMTPLYICTVLHDGWRPRRADRTGRSRRAASKNDVWMFQADHHAKPYGGDIGGRICQQKSAL